MLGDVEGSVRLWEAQPEAMNRAAQWFDAFVSDLALRHGGARPVEQGEGDSFVAAFVVARDAVSFSVDLLLALQRDARAASLPFKVRIAVHTGAVQARDGTYRGPTLNRCARLRALAHGGQALVSGATTALVADDPPDGVALLDLGSHPLRDFDRPESVFQIAHANVVAHFPPLRVERGAEHRLPVALTTFIARGDEIAALTTLLDRNRVVTLTGAGGAGKTRLALEAGRGLATRFAGGVAWADAAPLADDALVAACVAGAIRTRESPGEPLVDTVVREIGDAAMLLVIDNCEHVIGAAAALVTRLASECPNLRVLATSREPLGVNGEATLRVPSLADEDAATLFIDRARAVQLDFDPSPYEAAIADVCRRLDGIPLAIELAAARVRVLTPAQIADGLSDRFRLLTGGARTALPRQRTLEASVDWSYRLLSANERVLLARLSVFSGGFSLAAADAVCGAPPVDPGSVLDLLTALVDRSLVQREPASQGGEARFRLLETIRHYARQRLADLPAAAAVRERHLEHFLAVAEDAGSRMEVGEELEWLDVLERDLDNLRAALEWADQQPRGEPLLRLAAALWLFWEIRCRFEEGRSWLRRALAAAPEPTATRAVALHGLGDISLFVLDPATVATVGLELDELAAKLDEPVARARATALLGWAASYHVYRDTDWARDALADVVRALEHRRDAAWVMCDAANAWGYACAEEGDFVEAANAFDTALELAEASRSRGAIQRAACFKGWCLGFVGDVDEAETHLLRAIETAEALGDTWWVTIAVSSLAQAQLRRGDLVGAELHARDAVARGQRERNPLLIGVGAASLAWVLAATGADDELEATLHLARPLADEFGARWMKTWLAVASAALAGRRRDFQGARRALIEAATDVGRRPAFTGRIALARAHVERIAGDDAAAESALVAALPDLHRGGWRHAVAEAIDELGVSASRRQQFTRAARLFGAAESERARLGVVRAPWVGFPAPDADIALVGEALGDAAFAAERHAGAAWALDEAVRFAVRGKGSRRRPATGWESLTPTELEIVRLVAEGLSNPDIAERLLLARGTVKVHLAHVFTKLGVTSRAELAAGATRRNT